MCSFSICASISPFNKHLKSHYWKNVITVTVGINVFIDQTWMYKNLVSNVTLDSSANHQKHRQVQAILNLAVEYLNDQSIGCNSEYEPSYNDNPVDSYDMGVPPKITPKCSRIQGSDYYINVVTVVSILGNKSVSKSW